MARPEPFLSIDAGIIAALATKQITCYPAEGTTLPGPLPCATCVMDDGAEPGFRGAQQGFKLGSIPYVIRYYVAFDGAMDAMLVWEDAYNGLIDILNALGADITLGAQVAAIAVTRAGISGVRTRDNDKPELMVEIETIVKTAAY